MNIRLKSIQRVFKRFFRRDREEEYRRLAIADAKLHKSHGDPPRPENKAADGVASIVSTNTGEQQPVDAVLLAEEDALLATLPRQVVNAVQAGNTAVHARRVGHLFIQDVGAAADTRWTRQVSEYMLQPPSSATQIQKRNVTMSELSAVMSENKVKHNMPLMRKGVVPVRRRSSGISRLPVQPNQRYPSFVRF